MHEQAEFLLLRLDESIAMMSHLRTADPANTAAFDALKQARAMVARAFAIDHEAHEAFLAAQRVAA